jgi:hypothetical protein
MGRAALPSARMTRPRSNTAPVKPLMPSIQASASFAANSVNERRHEN